MSLMVFTLFLNDSQLAASFTPATTIFATTLDPVLPLNTRLNDSHVPYIIVPEYFITLSLLSSIPGNHEGILFLAYLIWDLKNEYFEIEDFEIEYFKIEDFKIEDFKIKDFEIKDFEIEESKNLKHKISKLKTLLEMYSLNKCIM